MNEFWQDFAVESIFTDSEIRRTEVGPPQAPGAWKPRSRNFGEFFPVLENLLARAFVTDLQLNKERFILFSWNRQDGGFASWLSPLPVMTDQPLFTQHRTLLESFGGIEESSNPPYGAWTNNQNALFTEEDARIDASFIEQWRSFFGAEQKIPIHLPDFYVIATEANANRTICHRESGDVLLFATDHAFDFVSEYPGCPEYTLYRINRAHNFSDWTNCIAQQWLDAIA